MGDGSVGDWEKNLRAAQEEDFDEEVRLGEQRIRWRNMNEKKKVF